MKPRLLIHFCCAPCGMEVVEYFKRDYTVLGLWCNPNIYPPDEHDRRKKSLYQFADDASFACVDAGGGKIEQWRHEITRAIEAGTDRCAACYQVRLLYAYAAMLTENISYFTTTLLASPYQKHELVKKIGETIGRETFLYRDFRPLYYRGKNTAYQRGYYLQKYCGCNVSLQERTLRKKSRDTCTDADRRVSPTSLRTS